MPGNDKSKRYVKDLTGGLDPDTSFHERTKDALIDAINVTINNNRRKRGQLIPCIGTVISNYSFHSKLVDNLSVPLEDRIRMEDRLIRFC